MSFKLFLSGLLALIFLPVTAYPAKVTTHGFTCALPDGWYEINNPKTALSAIPQDRDGRIFAVVVEPVPGCPIPCEIDDESDYEKGFWKNFDSRMESRGHFHITNKDFRIINGIPFHIIDGIRDGPDGADAKVYLEIASTPGNGNIYGLLFARKGAPPQDDKDLQLLALSFAFLSPPQLAWYQPWLHQSSNIIGAPLFLVALGLGIYLVTILRRTDLPPARKVNVCAAGFCIAMLNGYWIAGFRSVMGILSLVLFAGFILLMQRLNKERSVLIAEGKVVGPTRKALKKRFWILLGAFVFGLVVTDLQLAYSRMSLLMIISSNIFTAIMFGTIFWFQRKKFFPETDSSVEPKP